MGYRIVRRPVRELLPPPAPAVRGLAALPPAPSPPSPAQAAMQVLMPVMGGLGMVMMMAANASPVFMFAGVGMLILTVAGAAFMLVGQRTGARRRAADVRQRYLAYLEQEREELRAAAREQADLASFVHPHPGALLGLASGTQGRLWERRPSHPDFLRLRIGLGAVPRAVRPGLAAPSSPLELHDPVCRRAAEVLVRQHTDLPDQPILVDLAGAASVTVLGGAGDARRAAGILAAQLAVFHAPDEVRVALCCPRRQQRAWAWLKWLPHCLNPAARDGSAPRRLVADSLDALRGELAVELSTRLDQASAARRLGGGATPRHRLVVLVDELTVPQPGDLDPDDPELTVADLGITVVRLLGDRLAEPGNVDVRVTVEGDRATVERPSAGQPGDGHAGQKGHGHGGAAPAPPRMVTGRLDELRPAELTVLARALAPLRLAAEAVAEEPMTATTDLPRLLGVDDVATYDVRALWRPRELRQFLRVPVGVNASGAPLMLDLKEAAHNGMGPHGLCVGATGSGKSELLRTLVLALAMTHPPERLSLVLVDYKGGATFAGLEGLPHTAGMISNLSDDLGLVDRVHDALFGEMKRRQQVLLDAGNLANITEYNRRRDHPASQGERAAPATGLPPLPNLLVVVDEFSELLTAKPDFIELFIAVGRIGRSIGVHLLLASQRLEEGRLRGLESFLSYRLGLRTFNEMESRAVLGVPDAFNLPPLPGSGYLKVDTTVFERFKAAYVSGAYEPPGAAPVEAPPTCEPFTLFNRVSPAAEATQKPDAADQADLADLAEQAEQGPSGPSPLDVVVERLAGRGATAHQVWLPPLPAALPLDAVAGPPARQRDLGLRLTGRGLGRLRIPVGLSDLPAQQRQEPFVLDLSGGTGHLAILGAPQSGKSGLLRTLMTAAALTHTPGEVAFYCVDLGGGALAALEAFPHVGTVSGRLDPDRLRRTVLEVAGQLIEREQLFHRRGIDSAATMRRLWHAGELPELPFADVFLVVDNYTAVKQDYDDLADVLADIAGRGLAFGVHLILTAPRWHDVRPSLQTSIGGRVELRLTDPLDSVIDRRLSGSIRTDQPGRCVTPGRLLAQVALPRVDARDAVDDLQAALAELGTATARAWRGPAVPPIRLLPSRVDYKALAPVPGRHGVPIGIGEQDLRPAHLDLFGADQHLLVFGDGESGKTNLLRVIAQAYIDKYTFQQVVFAVFDPRRSLLGFVPEDYLGAYAPTQQAAAGLAAGLCGELAERAPGDDVTPEQLRTRSWWTGPEIIAIVDDLDLLTGTSGNPLAPLLDFLPQARDVGLHLVVARHSGGAGRALFEPFLQRLKELGTTGFVMSGDRQEGQLWPGVYPSLLPPGRGQLVRRGQRPLLVQVAALPRDDG